MFYNQLTRRVYPVKTLLIYFLEIHLVGTFLVHVPAEYVCLSDVFMLDLSQVTIDLRCSVLFWIVLDPRTPSFQNISEG